MFENSYETLFSLIVIFFIFILPLIAKNKKKKTGRKAENKSINAQKAASSKMSGFAGKELRQELKNTDGSFHDRQHTHNRLDSDCYSNDSGSLEHYIRQLDSFLKAGIIDKHEYRVLLNRYSRSIR